MTSSFNVLFDPWIPCVQMDGVTVELSVHHTLLWAHQLQGVGGDSPLVTASLHRFLLAVMHRLLNLRDLGAWRTWWQAESLPEPTLERYWRRWRERFNLYDADYPFYQLPAVSLHQPLPLEPWLAATGVKSAAEEASSGPAISHAQAARCLVTMQTFAGLRPGYETQPEAGLPEEEVFFLLQGHSLLETLLLNLLWRPSTRHTAADVPAWEREPPRLGAASSGGYLGSLTRLSHAVRLILPAEGAAGPETIAIQDEAVASGPAPFDPQVLYRRVESATPGKPSSWLPYRFSPRREVWRDSAALVSASARTRRPAAIVQAEHLFRAGILPEAMTPQLIGMGLEVHRQGQTATVRHRQDSFPLPVALLARQAPQLLLEGEFWRAEEAAVVLRQVLANVLPAAVPAPERLPEETGQPGLQAFLGQYWASVQHYFPELLCSLLVDSAAASGEWRRAVMCAARQTLLSAVEAAVPPAQRALALLGAQTDFCARLRDARPGMK